MRITLKNRLFLTDVPDDLADRLKKRLRFKNPKWLENERRGRWNKGVPEYLSFCHETPGGGLAVPRGFIRHLILMCREAEIPHEIEDIRRSLSPVDFQFSGELAAFQETAVAAMEAKEFGVLSAPTGSGKTVMALSLVARRRQPAIIVVHTRELADQWTDRVGAFLGIPEAEVGLIGGGKREMGSAVTVALVQSLYKCANEAARHTGYLIVDECHRTPSRTFTEAVSAFDSRYMMGLSATPWRRDKLSRLIYWHLGDLHHEVAAADLVEEGHILEAEVILRETEFIAHSDPVRDYSKMLSELTHDDGRNHLIAADAAKEAAGSDGAILVLSDRKHHCETLQAILKFRHRIDAGLLTGDLSMAKRREVLDRLNAGEIRVLVATGQLVGEGFDCPDLTTLFIATPIRFSGRVIQYLGRVLRPAPGKKTARVYDYVDVRVGPLQAAAQARQRAYSGIRPAHEEGGGRE